MIPVLLLGILQLRRVNTKGHDKHKDIASI